jgi:hypothetical protein
MDGVIAVGVFTMLIAFITKGLDLIKYARAKDKNGVITLLAAAALGVGASFVFRWSDFREVLTWSVTGHEWSLASVNPWTVVIFGVSAGFTAAYGKDWIKARDNNDTAKTPPLIPPSG